MSQPITAVNLAGNISNPKAYLLADHLDAVLAAGEDLLKVHRVVSAQVQKPRPQNVRDLVDIQRRIIDSIRTLEMTLVMRALQARERAEELRRSDDRVDGIAGLFIGGTAPLADAAHELGDWTEMDYEIGDEAVEYLRTRGLIPVDRAGVVSLDELVVTPRFLVARRIELGPLLDLAATFLDALELFYDLYEDEDGASAELSAADVPPGAVPPQPR